MSYTAVDFEKNHGDLVRQQYGECVTAYKLDKALRARSPPICMTQGLLKQWLLKYGRAKEAAGAEPVIRISSRAELESNRRLAHTTRGKESMCVAFSRC